VQIAQKELGLGGIRPIRVPVNNLFKDLGRLRVLITGKVALPQGKQGPDCILGLGKSLTNSLISLYLLLGKA